MVKKTGEKDRARSAGVQGFVENMRCRDLFKTQGEKRTNDNELKPIRTINTCLRNSTASS